MSANSAGASITAKYSANWDDLILVTGASGFIGPHVVEDLLQRGFAKVRCLVRDRGKAGKLARISAKYPGARIELFAGNLLSKDDCSKAVEGVAIILHLAAGRGEKSIPDAYLNSVVTTRNLLEAAAKAGPLRRFVNVSSFTVYSNRNKPRRGVLDERCPVEDRPEKRGNAYDFAKIKQEEIVNTYAVEHGFNVVTVRPGYVYGPGNEGISGRVGVGTFGVFLHLGGPNKIPVTHVQNCAEAIALAGLVEGVDGEVFNVVDDHIPTSRRLLRLYKRNVKRFHSVYLPHVVSFALCWAWEKYCDWSHNQLPPSFNRRRWYNQWKQTSYSNEKLKKSLGWIQVIPTDQGLAEYFEACKRLEHHA